MLGFFDSGFGGLTVLKEVVKRLPQYSTIYLGDSARVPYGNRSEEAIYKFTKEGVADLFKRGAELVVLACNTSSSGALRRLQQEWLPRYWEEVDPSRSRKILGIIIPTAEGVACPEPACSELIEPAEGTCPEPAEGDQVTKTRVVGVLATSVTINSGAYPREIAKINPAIEVYSQACPGLVPLIEGGKIDDEEIEVLVEEYLDELFLQAAAIDTLILACTHFPVIQNRFRKFLPEDIKIITQGPIVAKKLEDYLVRHPEIENKILKNSERKFYTTGNSEKMRALSESFYGELVSLETIVL